MKEKQRSGVERFMRFGLVLVLVLTVLGNLFGWVFRSLAYDFAREVSTEVTHGIHQEIQFNQQDMMREMDAMHQDARAQMEAARLDLESAQSELGLSQQEMDAINQELEAVSEEINTTVQQQLEERMGDMGPGYGR